jgi:cytoskeleton protein RodZ
MTESNETAAIDAEAQVAVSAIGPSFKQAREALGLSVEDVASHLRLSLRQIHALENDEFSALPEATITRGFIRNYARLLEIPAEPLLEVYKTYSPAGGPKAITIQSANILISGGDRRPWLAYISASVVIALLLGAWLLYFEYPKNASDQPSSAPVAASAEISGDTVTEPLPIAALPAAERDQAPMAEGESEQALPPASSAAGSAAITPTNDTATPAVPAPSIVPAPATSATPSQTGVSKLTMHFSQQTWVSVVDRDDKEIVNKNKPAGSDEIVEATPPLKLIIGNAAATSLTYNGKSVDLGPHSKLNVARLTLE